MVISFLFCCGLVRSFYSANPATLYPISVTIGQVSSVYLIVLAMIYLDPYYQLF